ncbi:four helix bundle protein [Ulvibacter sp. MAR_2010_11]|uniref:four helix bundle protein n=1 Tax=Ulvibacter sp. MAR_2010_11 TaxID=1250229 RepID=UPI000C2CC236|nr:four helix bundle protein [Ulvibacter sp. MAR_2010_11]PKA83891.1 four helix bundle protein [Ulvibacter sp. MAR_2010_11]
MHKVEDLKIWVKSIELAKSIYQIADTLPIEEKYGLTSQIKRCAISIPSNIAEGSGRNSQKEFIQFLSIANGSAYELQTQLLLVIELQLISEEKLKPILEKVIEIQKMNYGFQKSLKESKY